MRLRHTAILMCCTTAILSGAQHVPAPAWKIRGALAAWGDSSPRVKAQALDQLRTLNSASILRSQEVEKLLDSSDDAVQASAIRFLGAVHAIELRQRFLNILDSYKKNSARRGFEEQLPACAAVEALAAIGAPEATNVAFDAFQNNQFGSCMGQAGEQALETLKSTDIVARLETMIKSGNNEAEAALLIGKIGAPNEGPFLLAHVRDKSQYTVNPFLTALGTLKARDQIPRITPLLSDKDVSIRAGAVEALGDMGDPSLEPLIATRLNDTDASVKDAACEALGALKAIKYAPQVYATAELLRHSDTGGDCLRALGGMGATAYTPEIATFLTGPGFVQDDAATALVQLHAGDQLGKIIDAERSSFLGSTLYPSIGIRPLQPAETVQLLSYIYDESARSDQLRALAYLDGGGLQDNDDLVMWLGYPPSSPTDGLDRIQALRTLSTFRTVWRDASARPRLLNDMEEQAALIVKTIGVGWRTEDIPELERVQSLMRSGGKRGLSTRADAVASVISSIKAKHWSLNVAAFLGIHATFWAAFLWLYPKYARVRALFFWNPWVRRIGGLGYVGALLTWVPCLRRRLFEPFRAVLIEDARTPLSEDGDSKVPIYFAESEVKVDNGELRPITNFLDFEGRFVLEGESGLGKTMFLRHLVSSSKRLCVFLPAAKCESGVVESIEAMLEGIPRDSRFLRTLIYSGTMDVIIDGLNEVGPNTVANVRSFLSSNTAGNILVATQPIDWKIPSGVAHLVIQPLHPPSIKEFLRSRGASLKEDALMTGKAYETACDRFVDTILGGPSDDAEALLAKRVLSNPMDLSVVSLMLSMGATPNLAALQEQQYSLMADDYSHVNAGRAFPLVTFSRQVFEMRLSDRSAIYSDQIQPELSMLESHKMVYRRVFLKDKADITYWYFRHEKIVDFFLLQVFLGDTSKQEKYINDARFRGVYFLLARFLPIGDATLLRERLLESAVDRADHTVSDGFIKALRERRDTVVPLMS